jgi:hypothetical protein
MLAPFVLQTGRRTLKARNHRPAGHPLRVLQSLLFHIQPGALRPANRIPRLPTQKQPGALSSQRKYRREPVSAASHRPGSNINLVQGD